MKRRAGASASNDDDASAAVSIPVMGRIAAGVPIDAIQHKTHAIIGAAGDDCRAASTMRSR